MTKHGYINMINMRWASLRRLESSHRALPIIFFILKMASFRDCLLSKLKHIGLKRGNYPSICMMKYGNAAHYLYSTVRSHQNRGGGVTPYKVNANLHLNANALRCKFVTRKTCVANCWMVRHERPHTYTQINSRSTLLKFKYLNFAAIFALYLVFNVYQCSLPAAQS